MESGHMIEAVESKIPTPTNSNGEDDLSIPSKKIESSSTSSSASDSSIGSSFELISYETIQSLTNPSNPLNNDDVYVAGHPEPEYKIIDDEIETRPLADLTNASHSFTPLSSSSASDSLPHDPIPSSIESPSVTQAVDLIVESPASETEHDIKIIEPDFNGTSPILGSTNANTVTGDLEIRAETEVGDADDITRIKNLQTSSPSSSSSSSESDLEPKVELQQGDVVSNSPTDHLGSPYFDKSTSLVSDMSDEDIPISCMPGSGGVSPEAPRHSIDLNSGSVVPPTQVMERVDDPTSSSYRIPSRVFTRTKSSAPMEWSAASNESLFSIHMGNMSFTREQLCWLGKSGELCRPGEYAMSPLIDLSNKPSSIIKPSDSGSTHKNGELVVTEATAAATMREVIREHSENQRKDCSTLTDSSSHSASLSHHSESSTKSFQFPILTGDGGKSISLKGGSEKPKHQNQQLQQQQQQMAPESPRTPSSNPQTPKEQSADDQSPRAAPNIGPRRWLSCFSCCPFCS